MTVKLAEDLHDRAWKLSTKTKPRTPIADMVRAGLEDYLKKRGA